MKLITVPVFAEIVSKVGISPFIERVRDRIEYDFGRWGEFQKIPRPASHFPTGVIEVMPTSDATHYGFKYVNGHPANTAGGKLCVAAIGLLAEGVSGYPVLLSEMTILTAIRTAATSALAAKYLAPKESFVHSICGTGAQAEFQILAMNGVRKINEIRLFDIDIDAVEKTKQNLSNFNLNLKVCSTKSQLLEECDILTTATAVKKDNVLFESSEIPSGIHINAIGGDCPGKTEFSRALLERAEVFAELIDQTKIEGEIQTLEDTSSVTELHEVISGASPGRVGEEQITFFDSVGFAIEDFSALMVLEECSRELNLGEELSLIPSPRDPKNLFGELGLA